MRKHWRRQAKLSGLAAAASLCGLLWFPLCSDLASAQSSWPASKVAITGKTAIELQDAIDTGEIGAFGDNDPESTTGQVIIGDNPKTTGAELLIEMSDAGNGILIDGAGSNNNLCGLAYGFDADAAITACILNGPAFGTRNSIIVSGEWRADLDGSGNARQSDAGNLRMTQAMLTLRSDTDMSLIMEAADIDGGGNIFVSDGAEQTVWGIGKGGEMFFCDPTDLGVGILTTFDAVAETITADSGTPFGSVATGDWLAIDPRNATGCGNRGWYQVTSSTSSVITVDGLDSGESSQACEINLCNSWMDTSAGGAIKAQGHFIPPSGTDPSATCEVGEIFVDTDTSDDTNCITDADGDICICGPADTWTNKSGSGGGASTPPKELYIENPAVELFESVRHFMAAATATSIHCQCRGGTSATMQWMNDDGTPTTVDNDSIVCGAEAEDLTLTGDTAFAAGDDLDLDITAVDGAVTDCSFFLYFE